MKHFRSTIKKIIPLLLLILIIGLILSRIYSPDPDISPEITIHASDASKHRGKLAEVCGVVASARIVQEISGEPTFINLEKPYPEQQFTAVIWGEHRDAWKISPEELYLNRAVCITGTIRFHEDVPQIIVTTPEQIRFQQ